MKGGILFFLPLNFYHGAPKGRTVKNLAERAVLRACHRYGGLRGVH